MRLCVRFLLSCQCHVDVFIFTVYLGYNKLFIDTTSRLITTRPEFYIALITMVLGTQFFIAGFIAEIILKFNLNKNAYSIKNKTF